MRYSIIEGKVVPSLLIDAPYDTEEDALSCLYEGVKHNCPKCTDEMCIIGQDNKFKE